MSLIEVKKNSKIIKGIKSFIDCLDDEQEIICINKILKKAESYNLKYSIENLKALNVTSTELGVFRASVTKMLRKEYGDVIPNLYDVDSVSIKIKNAIYKTFDYSDLMHLHIIRGRSDFKNYGIENSIFIEIGKNIKNEILLKFNKENKPLINKYFKL